MKKVLEKTYWIVIIFLVGFVCGVRYESCKDEPYITLENCTYDFNVDPNQQIIALDSRQLPSQMDIQRHLIGLGYDLRLDGVIGPDSRKAWDDAYCQQSAEKWFEESEVE
jgi:hypothetical protein